MYKVFRLIFIFTIFICLVRPAAAALDLELTQGVSAALPIAIIPFNGEAGAAVAGNTTLSAVVNNDLQNSGEFRVTSVNNFDYERLRKQGINDAVIGQVTSKGRNRYQVTFSLISLFNSAQPSEKRNPGNSVLLKETYTVDSQGLRALAHHISDKIYQKLTGVRGVFSTKIAYVLVQNPIGDHQKFTLEVADADGFNPQVLLESTQPIVSPTWSPNGRKLAYVSFENHEAAIYLQDFATGKRQLVSRLPGVNSAPAFSRDGSKLALVLTLAGSPNIYVLNISTHKLTQITKGYVIDTEPAWAPDGKSLLFTSNRGGQPQIYRYYFANAQIDRLTFDGNYNASASFLPDEKSIVMVHREADLFGIARQSLETGRIDVLVQTGRDESPSLAPNGKMILYATKYGGRGVLSVVSVDGRIKLRLPAREGSVQNPAWSPFLS